ncbi:MAG: outer membrane lipoprotein-sorting protein, partial [Candidatus Thioglobus sp.]|nr:outer membrane lipoprotein-sorting protein [Candidatus Thioglobus sp.]
MNKLLSALGALLISSSVFAGNQAREIMEKVDARDDGTSLISTMKMTLIDKNGKKRNRQMRTFAKDIDANTEHKTIFFLSPSDVKNTAFLT